MGWRFYAQRATTGLWLDTNVQLDQPSLSWTKSGPMSGQAKVTSGLSATYLASDGRPTWGRMDTLLFGEEDGQLSWFGVCIAANPAKEGQQLMFIGHTGWLQRVPFTDNYKTWRRNVYDVVRHIINHAAKFPDRLPIVVSGNQSAFTIGDPEPPPRPVKPARKKGETKSQYLDSNRYKAWLDADEIWVDQYGDRQPFELTRWEAPFIGEEVDQLAKEVGFDYRETVRWRDKGKLTYELGVELSDNLVRRRTDIAFKDGLNLAAGLDPKDGDDIFANHVIGLGAGEGKDVVMVGPLGQRDGRLYQVEYVSYKTVKDPKRLRDLAQADQKVFSSKAPKIGQVVIWDQPGSGYADISTLRPGDEVQTYSQHLTPVIDTWVRILKITRNPLTNAATIVLERAS